ncbi:MAG TPA: hypothetical protein VFC29_03285, partial [Candidatus Limnocylindrales bacterium]|nr:hypothetical protein [Candidatus Limnocylindrales bacterium]
MDSPSFSSSLGGISLVPADTTSTVPSRNCARWSLRSIPTTFLERVHWQLSLTIFTLLTFMS